MLRHCKTNGLSICIAVARPLGHPQGTHGSPRGMVQLWQFFFLVEEESCLVLETISLDHGNIPTGFARVSSRPIFFFAPFYSTSMANFDIVSRLFILSAREGLFFINFMSFTRVFEWFCLSRNTILGGWLTRNQISSASMRIFETLLSIQTFSFFQTHLGVFFFCCGFLFSCFASGILSIVAIVQPPIYLNLDYTDRTTEPRCQRMDA